MFALLKASSVYFCGPDCGCLGMNVKFEIAIFLGRLTILFLLTVSTGIDEFYIRTVGPGLCWMP